MKIIKMFNVSNRLMLATTMIMAVFPAYADFNKQINRTVSREVNDDISKGIMRKGEKNVIVGVDKRIYAKVNVRQAQKMLLL